MEQISLMKPKAESEHDEGMLEYLEDIIGTNKFKDPIESAEKEVEELNEKRGEKVITFINYFWFVPCYNRHSLFAKSYKETYAKVA